MKNSSVICLLGLVAIALSGCVSTVPVNYAPSSAMSLKGSLSVGDFAYLPARNGSVTPNQVKNTALGSVKLDKNIDALFHDAVFKELRFMGITMDDPTKKLSGEIEEFMADDLGYSIDWTLRVHYVLTKDGKTAYSATKEVKRKTNKFINVVGSLNETIKLNIEQLAQDPAFVSAIK